VEDASDDSIPLETLEADLEVNGPIVGVLYVTEPPVTKDPTVDVLLEVG